MARDGGGIWHSIRSFVSDSFDRILHHGEASEQVEKAEHDLGDILDEWSLPDLPDIPSVENTIEFGDWQGIVDDYLSDAPNSILHDFDIGFGPGMADADYDEMMAAREEFLDWMIENGYDLDDFWDDWRENYEAA